MKTCSKCGEVKNLDQFNKDKKSKDGRQSGCRECSKKASQKWREKHPDYHGEYFKQTGYRKKYYKENRQRELEYNKKWRTENKEKSALKSSRRRQRERNAPFEYRLSTWYYTKHYFQNQCCYCGKSADELHRDHVVPLVNGGGYSVDNIVPACPSCNQSKGSKDMKDWYQEQVFFTESRMNKIEKFLSSTKTKNSKIGKRRN